MRKLITGDNAQDIVKILVEYLGNKNQESLLAVVRDIWDESVFCACQECNYIQQRNANHVLAQLANDNQITIDGCIVLGSCNGYDIIDYFEAAQKPVKIRLTL